MKKIFTILFLLISSISFATNYYVKNTGSDANTGLSDVQAWQTIHQVSSHSSLVAGDTVFLNKGDTWREILTIPASGTALAYIVFSSYGTGDKPKIYSSALITTWTLDGGSIWKSDITVIDPGHGANHDGSERGSLPYGSPCAIFFLETDDTITRGHIEKTNKVDCTAEYDYIWIGSGDGMVGNIYIYSPTDPNTRYSGVEVGAQVVSTDNPVSLNDKDYICFDGLDIRYFGGNGISEKNPETARIGLIIRNCFIGYSGISNGGEGRGHSGWHSSTLIQDNYMYDNGRAQFNIQTWPGASGTLQDIIIENNTFIKAGHNSGGAVSTTGAGNVDDVIVRNNLFSNDPDMSVTAPEGHVSNYFIAQKKSTGTWTNLSIYNNLFLHTNGNAVQLEAISDVGIYNNTFYGVNQNLTDNGFLLSIGLGAVNTIVKNNIFYNNNNKDVNLYSNCVNFNYDDRAQLTLDYNLYYTEDHLTNNRAMLFISYGDGYFRTENWAAFKSKYGYESHSPTPADPTFVSAVNYHLQAGSPAIAAGIGVGLLTDYEGSLWADVPSIGAYEYNVTPPAPPLPPYATTYEPYTIGTYKGKLGTYKGKYGIIK